MCFKAKAAVFGGFEHSHADALGSNVECDGGLIVSHE